MTPRELDELADALFWLDRPDESAAAWHRAHDAYVEVGDIDAAVHAAWRAFFDHFLVGEWSIANGWLERLRSHLTATRHPSSAGLVALAESAAAGADGDVEVAADHAARAVAVGREAGDADLTALATSFEGHHLVAAGAVDRGMGLLDDAMVSVVGGRLGPLVTGWIYCDVLAVCHDIGDLRRAAEWTDAAMRWCDQLRQGSMYPGLCRVHRAELSCLRGSLEQADEQIRRACDELTRFDARYAGEAYYLAGEVARRRGDLEVAEEAYARAHELGRSPHPGLAQVWLSQGRVTAAVTALRIAADPDLSAPVPRTLLLTALVEAELRAGTADAAREVADEVLAIAAASDRPYLDAHAALCDGMVRVAAGDVASAVGRLRHAHGRFLELHLPFEAARVQVHLGLAARRAGDGEGAKLEFGAARAAFERLNASGELASVTALLGSSRVTPAGLTDREVEVLRRVAQGRTDRQIAAELSISEHTVARHVSNIRTKLGVASRAAATAVAVERDLL